VQVRIKGGIDRAKQTRTDVTTFSSVQLDFTLSGTDDKHAAALVEAFKRR
jgi:hypothetical protein